MRLKKIFDYSKRLSNIFYSYAQRETSIHLQIGLILFSIVLILHIFNKQFTYFHASDQRPHLENLTPKRQTGSGTAATNVKTGLYLRSFPEFNILNNSFIADVVLWFEFDPTAISLESVEKFSFEKGQIVYKSPPNTKLVKGNVLATYEVRVKFSSNLDYRFFPFSDHEIFLVLTNKFISPNEMVYEAHWNGFLIAENIYARGWKYFGREVDFGFSSSVLDKDDATKDITYPRVLFTFKFSKSGFRRIFLIIIPILLMYFMSLFSLSLDVKRHVRPILSLTLGSMTSLLGYRFVIERMSPEVGYFTLADYLYTYILIIVFFIFLFGVYSVRKEKHVSGFYVFRIVSIFLLHISVITYIFYLLNFWQP